MGCIIARTRFINGHTIAHFVVVYTFLRRNNRRPSPVAIVVQLTDGAQRVRTRFVLHGKDNLFRVSPIQFKEVGIVVVELILPQVDDGLCCILRLLIVGPI